MTPLHNIAPLVRAYCERLPARLDSDVWRDFIAFCHEELGTWQEDRHVAMPDDIADCWRQVAAGRSVDYDAVGARVD